MHLNSNVKQFFVVFFIFIYDFINFNWYFNVLVPLNCHYFINPIPITKSIEENFILTSLLPSFS